MKQNKITKKLFIIVFLTFMIFFICVKAVENYYTNKKILLFVNGLDDISEEERQKLNINSITYGIWDAENHKYDTNDKYILLRMKSQKVILSTNKIEDVIEYTNKE